jgi:glycosyltransferase involved in cell wall biosynthesis
VLGRPQRVRPTIDSVVDGCPPCRLLFICDPGDSEEIREIEKHEAEYIVVDGNYATKINEGIRQTSEPFVFLGADDLKFHPGWFDTCMAQLEGGAEVVGTNDLCNKRVLAGEHATHSLVTRSYTERGLIDGGEGLLFEGYQHEYVDDELVGTAKKRGAFALALDAIVEHLHPDVGKAPMDDLYAGQRSRMRASWPLFNERKALWT